MLISELATASTVGSEKTISQKQAQIPGSIGDVPFNSALRFRHIGLEDGLSQNAVLSIFQDHQGFLWVGTQDGLNRYDGYEFQVLKNDPEASNTLSSSSILAILEDSEGIFWLGTWGAGLNRYDELSGRITRFQHDPENPDSLSNDVVTALHLDQRGRLWIGTSGGGLDEFDRESGKFIHHTFDPQNLSSLSSNFISSIVEDKTGKLWIGTGSFGNEGAGLNYFDPEYGTAKRYTHDPARVTTLSSNTISSLVLDGNGMLWLGTGGYGLAGAGLNRMDPKTGLAERFQHATNQPDGIGSNDVFTLLLDSAGMLWVGSWDSGLDRLDPMQKSPIFYHYRHDAYNPQSLSSDVVWSLFEDRSGILWVGTVNGGLNLLNPQVQRFQLYRNHPNDSNTIGFDVIGPILPDRDGAGIWIGTLGGGLEYLDRKTGAFFHYSNHPDEPPILLDQTLLTIAQTHDGAIWAGTMGGIAILDRNTGAFSHIRHDPSNPDSLISDNVMALQEDAQNRMWVGTLNGLDWYDQEKRKFNHVKIPELISAVNLFIDRSGFLWIGTWGQGLFRVEPNSVVDGKVRYVRFKHNPDEANSLSENSVWAIHQTQDGDLWMGTQRGLNRLDLQSNVFRRYTEKDGLSNNSVLCILDDLRGLVWISTNDGLNRFDPQSNTFETFDSSDGLQSDEFNSGSCARDEDGKMYFGGVHGMSVFNPEDILANPIPPQVVVTTFRVFNEPIDVDLYSNQPLQLSHRQNFIAFEFVALDFHAPDKNQYAYRLEGFDEDWVYTGQRRYASYTNLGGGDYVFRVKAANSDGVWNEQGVAIPLHITPPFWQIWWFQVGTGFALVTMIIIGVRLRLDSIRDKNRQLEVLVGQRTEELSRANQQLEQEIFQRKRAEEALAKRANEELQQSEARFRAMFRDAAIGIGLMNLDRTIIEANPTIHRMLGSTPEQMRNLKVEDIIHPDDVGIDKELYAELTTGKRESFNIETRYIRSNGSWFWGRLTLSLVRDLYGQPKFLVGMMEDIDEQRRSRELLAEQERHYRQILEKRVEERTFDLVEANKRLQLEIEQRLRVEEALSAKAAEEAVMLERARLAHELHDAVTQTLFAASLIAEVLPDLWELDRQEGEKSLHELRQLTRGALAEMRTLLLELRPAVLMQTRFEDLLRQLTEALVGRARLPIDLNIQGQRSLPADVQIALYRITQESLNNIFKYAKATQVWIDVQLAPSGVHLSIRDNGVGFNKNKIKPNSLGMRIMQERAENISAELEILSAPSQGTQVTVIWNSDEEKEYE